MVPISQVAKVANGHRTAADFDIANRPLAAAHAVEEIFGMAVTVVQVEGARWKRFFPQGFGSGFKLPAVDQDFSFGSDEENAAAVAVNHLDAIGVQIADASRGFRVRRRDD